MRLNESTTITKSKEKSRNKKGVVAQLGEHLPCTQGVGSSILPGSTKPLEVNSVQIIFTESNLIWNNQKFINNLVENEETHAP